MRTSTGARARFDRYKGRELQSGRIRQATGNHKPEDCKRIGWQVREDRSQGRTDFLSRLRWLGPALASCAFGRACILRAIPAYVTVAQNDGRIWCCVLRVGLTGGIACGKSTVAELLGRRGAHCLSADGLAHQLYAPGAVVYDEVVRRFGRGILEADGTIDRKKLANVVFPDRIDELNAVVHPAVIEAQNRWTSDVERSDPSGIAIVEAALLLEAGANKDFDKVIVVTCDFERKVERFARRSGLPVEAARVEVERRSAAQWSDEEKAQRADYVIENSGAVEDLERQVEKVWEQLRAASSRDEQEIE